MKKLIEIKGLTKNFDDTIVLKGIDLDIYEQEFVTLLGPSGCGKTTTLRIIGGFEQPTKGEVYFGGELLNNIPSYKRLTNTVFQSYALFPHLNVFENIAYGLRLKKNDEIYEDGVADILNDLDENTIKAIVSEIKQREEKSFKAKAIAYFYEKSNYAQFVALINNITKEDRKSYSNYEKALNEILKNLKIKVSIDENLSFNNNMKEIKKVISIDDKDYLISKKIGSFSFKENVISDKVIRMLKLVNLENFEKRNVTSLSGGQQQRVAIARALVNNPKVLLLDEPLAALDLKLRQEMQYELKKIQKDVGITFIFVTHDQEEALTMSDKIVVMNEGEIQQVGTPIDVYNEPANRFVAKFIGESNIIDGVMKKDYLVSFDNIDFECLDNGFKPKEAVDVVIRPEDIDIVKTDKGFMNGEVISNVFKGVHYEMNVKTSTRTFLVHTTDFYQVGSNVGLKITPDDIHVMEKMDWN